MSGNPNRVAALRGKVNDLYDFIQTNPLDISPRHPITKHYNNRITGNYYGVQFNTDRAWSSHKAKKLKEKIIEQLNINCKITSRPVSRNGIFIRRVKVMIK